MSRTPEAADELKVSRRDPVRVIDRGAILSRMAGHQHWLKIGAVQCDHPGPRPDCRVQSHWPARPNVTTAYPPSSRDGWGIESSQVKDRDDVVDGLENAPPALIGPPQDRNFGKLLIKITWRAPRDKIELYCCPPDRSRMTMFQPSLQIVCYLLARMIGLLFALLLLTFCSLAEEVGEEPIKVTVCQLANDPARYNQMLVQVTGFASYGFENFTINDPSCSSMLGIWLEYGGTAAAGTKYCCGESTARRRPEQLVVEDIPISLVEDERFREFDRLVHRRFDSSVHVTLVGRFFSGRQKKTPNSVFRGGYGHFGCCSLLAIEQVTSVDPQDRDDLDYNTSFDETSIAKRGCGYQSLYRIRAESDLIEAQRKAEQSQSELSFDDPKRVASGHLAQLLKIDEKSVAGIKQTCQAPGRFVYEWRPTGKREGYLIVVSRPSLLSFYAKDPRRVAWIVVAVYRSLCR